MSEGKLSESKLSESKLSESKLEPEGEAEGEPDLEEGEENEGEEEFDETFEKAALEGLLFWTSFMEEGRSVELGVTIEDVNPEELALGITIEIQEHTTSEDVAKKIALDHLAEFPQYYSCLTELEKAMREETETSEAKTKEKQ
jgi:hypothetical protein